MSALTNGGRPARGLSCVILAADIELQIVIRSRLRETGVFGEMISLTRIEEARALLATERCDLVFVSDADVGLILLDGPMPDWTENRFVLLTSAPLDPSTQARLAGDPRVRAFVVLPLDRTALDMILSGRDEGSTPA